MMNDWNDFGGWCIGFGFVLMLLFWIFGEETHPRIIPTTLGGKS